MALTGTVTAAEFDAALLLANCGDELLPTDGVIWQQGERATGVAVVSGGIVTVTMNTPYGPHQIAATEGPVMAGLAELQNSEERIATVEVKGVRKAALIRYPQVLTLLGSDTRLAVAFRRLALFSLERLLRQCNEQLFVYFQNPSLPQPENIRASGAFRAMLPERPADPREVAQLLAAPELDPVAFQQLGLVKRTYPAGAKLAKKGTPGDEAFFIASGRVRVSLRIPGVGEEALTILGPGQITGEMALIDDAPRSADLIAHERPVDVFVLNRTSFRKMMSGTVAGSGWLGSRIALALTQRLAETLQRSVSFYVLSGGNQAAGTAELPPLTEEDLAADDDEPLLGFQPGKKS